MLSSPLFFNIAVADGTSATRHTVDSVESRKTAIATSLKPRMHVIDLVDNCGKHKVYFTLVKWSSSTFACPQFCSELSSWVILILTRSLSMYVSVLSKNISSCCFCIGHQGGKGHYSRRCSYFDLWILWFLFMSHSRSRLSLIVLFARPRFRHAI